MPLYFMQISQNECYVYIQNLYAISTSTMNTMVKPMYMATLTNVFSLNEFSAELNE